MQMTMQTYEEEQESLLAHVPSDPYILVIDDDSSILSVISFLLDTEDYPNLCLSESTIVLPLLEK